MTAPMGDRVPPQTMTDAQEDAFYRLEEEAFDRISAIRPQDVYEHLSMDWLEGLNLTSPLVIPGPGDVAYEDLNEHQKLAWEGLTGGLVSFLQFHLDEDTLTAWACGRD